MLVSVSSVCAELQLTPRMVEYEVDGITRQQLAFDDGTKTVTYQSPRSWLYFGTSTQLILRPPGKLDAEATVTRVPLSGSVSFDEEDIKRLVDDALERLPQGGEKNKVLSQEKNPLMIQGKETFLVTISYTLYGQQYARSILFLNRGDEQIRSQLTCREEDFKELQAVFLRSQFTWQNL